MVVTAGTMLVEETNADFQDVSNAVKKVTDLVGEISAATSEQARGITEVSRAVGEMDKVTQQTAANSAEVAESAAELGDYAHRIQDISDRLNVLVEGDRGPRPGAHRALPGPGGSRDY
jgi:methyl-accepting chemotaxis protein